MRISNKVKGGAILSIPFAAVLGYGTYQIGWQPIVWIVAIAITMTALLRWGVVLYNKPTPMTDDEVTSMLGRLFHPDTPMKDVMEQLHQTIKPPVPDYELPDFTDGDGNQVRGGDCIGKPRPDGEEHSGGGGWQQGAAEGWKKSPPTEFGSSGYPDTGGYVEWLPDYDEPVITSRPVVAKEVPKQVVIPGNGELHSDSVRGGDCIGKPPPDGSSDERLEVRTWKRWRWWL